MTTLSIQFLTWVHPQTLGYTHISHELYDSLTFPTSFEFSSSWSSLCVKWEDRIRGKWIVSYTHIFHEFYDIHIFPTNLIHSFHAQTRSRTRSLTTIHEFVENELYDIHILSTNLIHSIHARTRSRTRWFKAIHELDPRRAPILKWRHFQHNSWPG